MTRTEAKSTRTGTLLEELIRIAGISKKDFAEALSISQNVLSRILTGQRLVQFNEKSRLSRDAAEVLAPAVYGFNCYLKLGDLFPLIYDFASEHELHVFLEDAIEFAIEFDLMEAQQAGLPFPEYERVWLGRRRMLNLFCIIMSGLIREKNGDELRLYSSFSLLANSLPYDFDRIIAMRSYDKQNITLNHTLHQSDLEAIPPERRHTTINRINSLEQHFDLYIWESEVQSEQLYLLVEGSCLLLFNVQADGTPSLTLIAKQNYLQHFHRYIQSNIKKKLSYNREEMRHLLGENPDVLLQVLEKKPSSIFSSVPFGFLLNKEELAQIDSDVGFEGAMYGFIRSLMAGDVAFYHSAASVGEMVVFGKFVVPFVGYLSLPAEERIPLLQRFSSVVGEQMKNKTTVVFTSMTNTLVLCTEQLSYVYLVEHTLQREKLHLLYIDNVEQALIDSYHDLRKYDYTESLWQKYLDEAANLL